ncbi:unnamed protein product [Clonostachys rosea f. rosea IK726]|uniref:R3H domain-containing protein n=2 Tax=Bionectria ochroleuca TaxID=29856 RepID=A0A0B7JZI4_BIOOC|nr:unnamed protein product [Clonostachys rosea f. rosea IK726]
MSAIPPVAGPGIANAERTLNTSGRVSLLTQPRNLVVDNVTSSLGNLTLQPKDVGVSPVNGVLAVVGDRQQSAIGRDNGSDESQKADSNSELGTKPPSLDGKSITSGTTFALDEKESLRPDDSASVKAAGEDDDAFSVRGSLGAGSRMDSDLALRARGVQMGDISERRLLHITPGSSSQGVLTPQSTSSEQHPNARPGMSSLPSGEGNPDALNLIYRHAPDEKLIEALTSSKDRLFLLKLEKEVIDFVQNSKEPYMDLPPSNSFCRMLTHKLADYYHMTHSFEPNIGSVRIFRTPFCRVPTSLVHWDTAPNQPTSSTPPPVIAPKKIMRRGQDEDGGLISASPSKPTSEDGSDGKDGKDKQGNQKLTREEREEIYKLARERIFGSSEDTPTDGDGDNGVSRASSVSANRSNLGKRGKSSRQRRDDSDSFDSRNHYTPYWGPQQQTWIQQTAPPQGNPGPPSQPFPGQMPPVYTQQNTGYPAVSGMVLSPGYPNYQMAQYPPPQQVQQQRYPPHGSPMNSYGSPAPAAPATASAQPQTWQPGFNPNGPQGRGSVPPTAQSHMGIPYAFGQLPANLNPHDPKTQHPIPGSYNRNHSFNPKTQSFIPGGNNIQPVPPPQPPFTAPTSHTGSPQIGSPHLAFPQYQQGGTPQPYGGGYGMIRQASNHSVPGYASHQPITAAYVQHPPPPPQNPHHGPIQHPPGNMTTAMPNRPNGPPHQMFGHLPTYGNPATLPQKPATGI